MKILLVPTRRVSCDVTLLIFWAAVGKLFHSVVEGLGTSTDVMRQDKPVVALRGKRLNPAVRCHSVIVTEKERIFCSPRDGNL